MSAHVAVVDGPTGIAHIRVDTASGQNDIVVVPHANHRLSPDGAEAALRALAGTISVVLVQLEIPVEVVVRVSAVCRELGLRLILDPAPAQPLPDAVWPGVFVAKPNESEAAVMTGVEVRRPGLGGRRRPVVHGAWGDGGGDHPGRARARWSSDTIRSTSWIRSRSRSSTPPPPATRSPERLGAGLAGGRPLAEALTGPWPPPPWR